MTAASTAVDGMRTHAVRGGSGRLAAEVVMADSPAWRSSGARNPQFSARAARRREFFFDLATSRRLPWTVRDGAGEEVGRRRARSRGARATEPKIICRQPFARFRTVELKQLEAIGRFEQRDQRRRGGETAVPRALEQVRRLVGHEGGGDARLFVEFPRR